MSSILYHILDILGLRQYVRIGVVVHNPLLFLIFLGDIASRRALENKIGSREDVTRIQSDIVALED